MPVLVILTPHLITLEEVAQTLSLCHVEDPQYISMQFINNA